MIATHRPLATSVQRREVTVGPIRWSYTVEGQGPTLLALHGTGSSSHSFRGLSRYLGAAFEIVAPDLPGHGDSWSQRHFTPTLSAISRALDPFLACLGRQPSVVIGHSAGAAIAASWALAHPTTAARWIGLAPALVPLPTWAQHTLPWAARLLANSTTARWLAAPNEALVRTMIRSVGSRVPNETVASYRDLASSPAHVKGTLRLMATWDLRPLYTALRTFPHPALLIAGGRDRAIPLEHQHAVARRMGAPLQTIARAGHLVHEECPSDVANMILRFAGNPSRSPSV